MKVDKTIPPIVRGTVEKGIEQAKNVVENHIKEFSDKAGEVAGRTKVLLDSAREITDEELAKIKDELKKKMIERNFSPKAVDEILWGTTKKSHKLAKMLVYDEYANPQDIGDILCDLYNLEYFLLNVPKVDHYLLEAAVEKKNYIACKQILHDIRYNPNPRITSIEQIEDVSADVIKSGKYQPKPNAVPVLSAQEFNKQVDEIQRLIKDKKDWDKSEAHHLNDFLNSENIDLVKILANDSNVSLTDIRTITSFGANANNAELLLIAALNKDYQGMFHILGYERVIPGEHPGLIKLSPSKIRIGKLDTLSARYAGFQRPNTIHAVNYEQTSFHVNPKYMVNHNLTGNGATLKHEMSGNQASFYDIVREYCTDDVSEAAKILLEDTAYSNEIAAKILQKLTMDNVQIFKKALIEKDFAALEKLCNQKFNQSDIDIAREQIKVEYKTTSTTGKITRNDFIRYMSDKLAYKNKADVSTLKDSEIRNLAKLFGTTEEQIRNMDKREYRRLCIITHPDRNPNDNMANHIFGILHKIYQG